MGNYRLAHENYYRTYVNTEIGHADDQKKALAMYNLGRMKGHLCMKTEAEPLLLQSVAIEEKAPSRNENWYTGRLVETARFYLGFKEYAKAIPYFEKATVRLVDSGTEQEYPVDMAQVWSDYADALRRSGSEAKAEEVALRAQRLRDSNPGKSTQFPSVVYGRNCNVEVDEIRAKAEQGDTNAEFTLGSLYDAGLNVKKDQKEAIRWLMRAAEKGHSEAQNSLGSMYQAGDGVARDYAEAIRWYTLAANQNNNTALMNLGYMYDEGLSVPEDNRRAIELYTQAAEHGKIGAMLNLGLMFVKEEQNVSRDPVLAFMWFDLCRHYAKRTGDTALSERAGGYTSQIRKEMTKEQVERAAGMAKEWDAAMVRKWNEQKQNPEQKPQ